MNTSKLEFQEIYNIFQPKILRYLAHFAGEQEAEDLTQETFVKIHQGLENFRASRNYPHGYIELQPILRWID